MLRHWMVAIVAGLMVVSASATQAFAAEAKAAPKEDPAAQLKDLKKQRIEQLELVVKGILEQRRIDPSGPPMSALMHAQTELVNAQLDAAEKPQDRIAVLTKYQDTASEYQKQAQAMVNAGYSVKWEVNAANAYYLGAKIRLLREQARQKAAGK